MLTTPRLLPVEYCHENYTVKATVSGVTILKQNRFKKRYTGSKAHAVDINGKLWTDPKKLAELIGETAEVRPKKRVALPSTTLQKLPYIGCKDIEVFNELSTNEVNFLTNTIELLTQAEAPQVRVKSYKIHKREVRQRLLGMINTKAGKKELYFWTVTFPEKTPDKIAYQAFNTWLTTLRTKDKFGRRFLKEYLWIAERQQNGTIHFHIAIPHKMPVQYANGAMRTILKTFSKRNDILFSLVQCKRYNGVDIAKNRKTKRVVNFAIKKGSRSLVGYLTKYITKNDGEFQHLAWHNSRGFSALFTGITFTEPQFRRLKDGVNGYMFTQMLNRAKAFANEYFWYIPWRDDLGPPGLIVRHLYELNSHLQDVTNEN